MTAFAAIETATASAAVAALANASATLGGGTVSGIFDAAFLDTFGIVANTSPALLIKSTDIGTAAVGSNVVIGATTYTIAEIQPDGTGMTRLMLKS